MQSKFRWVVLALDAAIVIAVTLAAAELRQWMPFLPDAEADVRRLVIPIVPWIILGWVLTLILGGSYRPRHWGAGVDEYRQVINASVGFLLVLALAAFLFNYPLSRIFVALLFLIGIPALALGRLIARRVLHGLRRRGKSCVRTLVAGHPEAASDVIAVLGREPWLGYDAVGVLSNPLEPQEHVDGVPIVGTSSELLEAVNDNNIGAVIFTSGSVRRGNEFNAFARTLERHRTQMIVVPAMTDIAAQRISVTPVAGIPLMHVGKPQAERSLKLTKRLFDIVGSSLILLLISPLLLITALLVKLEDGGKVIFKQSRVGRGGQPFQLYKFRSMVPNAEQIRAEQLEEHNEADGRLFKMKKDPRVTRIGRFIRRYSIDELPQLFNVLKGEMSLIGPRPALANEVEQYKKHVRRRLDVRPGITGLWQVSGRSDLSWDDAVRLDLYYVDNWSLVQDIVILMKTVRAVLSSRGAY
ncbi:sugar transferase [Tessaracoccus massiliensis]|uniref:sugar transferase n=1 Tax=Tessaracoccus massiliensis TaxID=1522311 RepID=UPI00069477B7|nr:sugar transferase [Tessaracoccus massiliensis]